MVDKTGELHKISHVASGPATLLKKETAIQLTVQCIVGKQIRCGH